MARAAIDLHDTGIRAADAGSGSLLAVDGSRTHSPGYALTTKQNVNAGFVAANQASIQPLNVDNRFWDALSNDGSGDRAFEHLKFVWQQIRPGIDEVIFAVPAHLDPYALGMLYSMCQELQLPVRTLVAAPVLATENGMHIDVLLHRTVFSLVKDADLVASHSEPNLGWTNFEKQWAKGIQSEFVRSTRFDPMHSAESEQKLNNHLALVLDALVDADTAALEIETHRINLTRGMMSEWSHALQAALCAAAKRFQDEQHAGDLAEIKLSYAAGRAPGLSGLIEKQLNLPTSALAEDGLLKNLLAAWPDQLVAPAAGQLTYQTALNLENGETTDI